MGSPRSTSSPPLPASTRSLLAFQSFNALNFTIAIGAPMVLLARFLGASEREVGMVMSLVPFLAILQLPGTALVERFGPRRVMIWGWSIRSWALLIAAALPLLIDTLSRSTLVLLLGLSLFLFSGIRGLASASWHPWLNKLLPEGTRGHYLGKEQRVMNLSASLALIVSALFLGEEPAGWRFSILMAAAWLLGLASTYFLARVPRDDPAPRAADRPRFHPPRSAAFSPTNLFAASSSSRFSRPSRCPPFRSSSFSICARSPAGPRGRS